MTPEVLSLILLFSLFLLLGSGVWIALSLIGVGAIGMMLFSSAPIGKVMATAVFSSNNSWALTSLPLFIWMAEILFRTRLSEDMFSGLAPWLVRLPGRLLHVNVVGCGIFAAVSGSSAATCVTIGKMSMPELMRRGYDERMSIGSLAGSGTLGLLIPPSIMMIVYGLVAEVSIARLFIAGVLPGIMLMGLFMGYIIFWAWLNPTKVPPADIQMTFSEKIYNSRRLIPVVLLIIAVIGSIYAGYATPTEAAAVGVLGSLGIAIATGNFAWKNFADSVMGAMRTSCMITLILAGAAFLAVAMGFTGLPRQVAGWIASMHLSVYTLLLALLILYIILGCFLDGISMVVLTTSVIQPLIIQAGVDVVWYGIFIVLVVEMAQITPPVGFNLFVLQGMTGKNIFYVAQAAFPFFLIMILAVVLITIFPQIVTYLPNQMLSAK
ncbi:MAG: TRAP transporter large permease subunit [Hyphomicrobiaceae bacterium]